MEVPKIPLSDKVFSLFSLFDNSTTIVKNARQIRYFHDFSMWMRKHISDSKARQVKNCRYPNFGCLNDNNHHNIRTPLKFQFLCGCPFLGHLQCRITDELVYLDYSIHTMGTRAGWEEMFCTSKHCSVLKNTGRMHRVQALDWQKQAFLMMSDPVLKESLSQDEVPEEERRPHWDKLFPK